MPIFTSPDGVVVFAMQTPGEGDGNSVVYYNGVAVWDRWSFEASHPQTPSLTAPSTPDAPPVAAPDPDPGTNIYSAGFVEARDANVVRPRLTAAQIATFVPEARGFFAFPPPYNTRGIRLTNGLDGVLTPREYSYWRQINQHTGRPTLLVLVDLDNTPTLLEVNKANGAVTNRGPIGTFGGDAEGWYFSATLPTSVYLIQGAQFCRYDVDAQRLETIYQAAAGLVLWQPSSSDDDQVHAATLKRPAADPDAAYEVVGCVVFRNGQVTVHDVSAGYDECQLDKTGRYLVIKQDDENVILDLEMGARTTITNAAGAVGHSDTGRGFVAGEDDQHEACACVRWDLQYPTSRTLLYSRPDWAGGMGHAAIVRNTRVCIANALGQDLARVNELVLVKVEGSVDVLVVAPTLMVDLPPVDVPYDLQVKANVDVPGEWALIYVNGTGRLDAVLVELPSW